MFDGMFCKVGGVAVCTKRIFIFIKSHFEPTTVCANTAYCSRRMSVYIPRNLCLSDTCFLPLYFVDCISSHCDFQVGVFEQVTDESSLFANVKWM